MCLRSERNLKQHLEINSQLQLNKKKKKEEIFVFYYLYKTTFSLREEKTL